MRILKSELAKFLPYLNHLDDETLVAILTNLGFETELIAGKQSVLEVKITPNRGDAMSHLGLARDLGAYLSFQGQIKPLDLSNKKITSIIKKLPEFNDLKINYDRDLISQYHAVILDKVTVKPSPLWLQEILQLLGIRPINNIVDLTNYLMEIYGQPLHAFDLNTIVGQGINIRAAKEGEIVITLDEVSRKLTSQAIVIEDFNSLIDLAGIMGGQNSQITHRTKRILLQSAIFNRRNIRLASRALAHRTAASIRYERGIDPHISLKVLDHFIELASTKEFGSSKARGKILLDVQLPKPQLIKFNSDDIDQLIGMKVKQQDQVKILESLGCKIQHLAHNNLSAQIPSWRSDLTIWQDLAEEIVRIIGLNQNVPSNPLSTRDSDNQISLWQRGENLKDLLIRLGLNEVYTYSFVGKNDLANLKLPKTEMLANPLNPELQFLRPSLVPGLIKVIAQNSLFDPILVFEIGHIFYKKEKLSLAIAIASHNITIETVIAQLADLLKFSYQDLIDKFKIYQLEELQKLAFKIKRKNVVIAEIDLESILSSKVLSGQFERGDKFVQYRQISKFPPVSFDVSLIVDQGVDANNAIDLIKNFDSMIENAFLFDEFVSERFGANKKSVAFRIFYSDPLITLKYEAAEKIHQKLLKALVKSFNAQIR